VRIEEKIGWEKSWVKRSNTELGEAIAHKMEERIDWVKSWVKRSNTELNEALAA
jgi:hypothetical protein